MIKAWDFKCVSCGTEWEEFTSNPQAVTCCGQRAKKVWKKAVTVQQDSIEGGVWIENMGDQPVKVYSESERKRYMRERGLEDFVRHTPTPGSDKSKYTSNWATISPGGLQKAKELLESHASRSSKDEGIQGVVHWESRVLPQDVN